MYRRQAITADYIKLFLHLLSFRSWCLYDSFLPWRHCVEHIYPTYYCLLNNSITKCVRRKRDEMNITYCCYFVLFAILFQISARTARIDGRYSTQADGQRRSKQIHIIPRQNHGAVSITSCQSIARLVNVRSPTFNLHPFWSCIFSSIYFVIRI